MASVWFAHLTDLHVNAPGNHPLFGMDMTRKVREVFAQLARLKRKPSFVVVSGDLTQDGQTDDYRHLRRLLDEEGGKLGVPVYVALGNHDSRPCFREGYLQEEPSEQSYYYSAMEEGLRLVVLNTQVPGTHAGSLDLEQLNWLRATLAEPAPLGTVVVLHHPVTPTPTALMDDHLLDNPDDLADAIAGSDVIGLLSGHIHFHSIGLFHGIPSAAASGVAFGLEPTSPDSMMFIDNSSYNLVLVKEGRMMVHPMAMPGKQRIIYEYKLAAGHASNG